MNSFYGNFGGGGWGMTPWSLGIGSLGMTFVLAILLVVLALKGFALWNAARRSEKWWFIILLVVNTVGILEIIYLLAVAKVWPTKPAASSPGDSKPAGE